MEFHLFAVRKERSIQYVVSEYMSPFKDLLILELTVILTVDPEVSIVLVPSTETLFFPDVFWVVVENKLQSSVVDSLLQSSL